MPDTTNTGIGELNMAMFVLDGTTASGDMVYSELRELLISSGDGMGE